MTDPSEIYERLSAEIETVLIGNEEIVEGLVVALLSNGHLLIEGVPGVAKTTVANLLARASGLGFNRIQMTPDLLPADITGTEVYNRQSEEFRLQRGPVFSNLIVVDEVNRAMPKTQSALLEAMEERRVSIGNDTLKLPEPFMVVATQNPIEMEGVYELPEAQRDRFQLCYRIDLLDTADERRVVDRFDAEPRLGPEDVESVVTPEEILSAQQTVEEVHVAGQAKDYLIDIVSATRASDEISHGASTRATLMLLNAAKARAAVRGRSYVVPDDIMELIEPSLTHRLTLETDADLSGRSVEDVLNDLVANVPLPEADLTRDRTAGAETRDR